MKFLKETRFLFTIFTVISGCILYQNCAPTGNIGESGPAALSLAALGIPSVMIIPPSATLPPNTQLQLSAAAGIPPYTFKMISGHGTLTSTYAFNAPSVVETDIVQVKDSTGAVSQATFTISYATPTPSSTPTPTPAPALSCSMTQDNYYYSATTGGVADLGNQTESSVANCAAYCVGLTASVCEYFPGSQSCKAWSANANLTSFQEPAGVVNSGPCQ